MTGQVPTGVVHVNERTVYVGDRFNNVLQTLAEIMAVAETCAFVEDDVDFDVELVAAVVSLLALDGLDGLGEAHGEVEQDVALVCRGGCAGQVADVFG